MLTKIRQMYQKHKEIALYLVFGGLTTALNFVVYLICSFGFGMTAWLSNAVAWVFAVLFAFITNKLLVFESKTKNRRAVVREAALFFASRAVSGVISTTAMFVFVDIIEFNEIVMFILTQAFVIVFNYIVSKWLVFKRK